MVSWCNQYTIFLKKSIGEKWILCYIINESENDFLKNLYDYGIFFDIVGFKEQWNNNNTLALCQFDHHW
jgi:hypothetical protein